mmetsp:Transcript_51489/g.112880  ORF Transcript_51489/g.112880 Transcript_51489/m.112880 type:complete len:260 (+) Transcript_51489:1426-2205(+)
MCRCVPPTPWGCAKSHLWRKEVDDCACLCRMRVFFRLAVRARGNYARVGCICLQREGSGAAIHSFVHGCFRRSCDPPCAGWWLDACCGWRCALLPGSQFGTQRHRRAGGNQVAGGDESHDCAVGERDAFVQKHHHGAECKACAGNLQGDPFWLHMLVRGAVWLAVPRDDGACCARNPAQRHDDAAGPRLARYLQYLLCSLQLVLLLCSCSSPAHGPCGAADREAGGDGGDCLRAPEAAAACDWRRWSVCHGRWGVDLRG